MISLATGRALLRDLPHHRSWLILAFETRDHIVANPLHGPRNRRSGTGAFAYLVSETMAIIPPG